MESFMEWVLTLLLNNWIVALMKLQKKLKASKVLFLGLLPGSMKQLHLAVKKGKGVILLQ